MLPAPIAFYGEADGAVCARQQGARAIADGVGRLFGEDGAKKGVRLKTSSFVRSITIH